MRLPRGLLEEVFSHARRDAPSEACGWLAGHEGEVERVYPVPNAAEEPEANFVMEPQAQISAMRAIREAGLEILGTYHSHPATPPVPSERDRELGLYPDIHHLIVSLSPEPEARLWRITEDGLLSARLKILWKKGCMR